MKFKSVTFDLDGTLLDTVADLAEASNRTMLELGLPTYSEDEIRNFIGRGINVLIERCLTREQPPAPEFMAQAIEAFKRHYAAVNGEMAVFYPGVLEGLLAWKATGLPMGVVTNKASDFTLALLKKKGLADTFDAIVAGDTTPNKKPHPEPIYHACRMMGSDAASNLHIGDSIHDIHAAKAAGSAAYCVPYGYNEGRAVRAEYCDALVADLLEALVVARA